MKCYRSLGMMFFVIVLISVAISSYRRGYQKIGFVVNDPGEEPQLPSKVVPSKTFSKILEQTLKEQKMRDEAHTHKSVDAVPQPTEWMIQNVRSSVAYPPNVYLSGITYSVDGTSFVSPDVSEVSFFNPNTHEGQNNPALLLDGKDATTVAWDYMNFGYPRDLVGFTLPSNIKAWRVRAPRGGLPGIRITKAGEEWYNSDAIFEDGSAFQKQTFEFRQGAAAPVIVAE